MKKKTQIFKNYLEFIKRKDESINGVSVEFAKANPNYKKDNETNIGCWDCLNCIECINCIECKNCKECNWCSGCKWCLDCRWCRNWSGFENEQAYITQNTITTVY